METDLLKNQEFADRFKAGMRELAAGVTIITTGHGDNRRGMTATAVCSASVDPPTLLVCMNRSADAHDFIVGSGAFCVNVLGVTDRELGERFAAKDGIRGLRRFEAGKWLERHPQPPALETAVASFDCELEHTFTVNTHSIFVGRVVEARTSSAGDPLIYCRRDFHAIPSASQLALDATRAHS